MKFRVAAILIAVLLAPLAQAQDAFVVPNSSETVEGDSNNTIPFTIAGGNVRYQQVYLDSEIPPGPFTIYGIAFRPDALQGSFTFAIPQVDIFLGPTEQGTTLSPEFDLNLGLVQTQVASGPLFLASAASGPPGGPLAFDIEIWFDQPFAYEAGNLLLDVSVQPYELGSAPVFDAVNVGPDAVSRVFSAGANGGSVNASSGIADTQGLVTKFMLPEPADSAAAGLVTLASLVWARRHGPRASSGSR